MPGETITVIVKTNLRRSCPVRVFDFQPVKRMVWSCGIPLGLFKGERTYPLEPASDGVTRFTMREEYTGPLLPMIWKSIPDLGPAFEEFAAGLKAEAEKAA